MKQFLILALVAFGALSCADKNTYTIEGTIRGLDERIYLMDEMGQPIDSAEVTNGTFRFKGVADTARVSYLGSNASSKHRLGVLIFVEPGQISIAGPVDAPEQIVVGGTPSNEAMGLFSTQSRELMNRYREQMKNPEGRAVADEEFSMLARKSLEQNQTNIFGAMLLAKQLVYEMSPQELLDAIAKFPASLREGELLRTVKEMADVKMRTAPGQSYIDVTQNNPEGQPVSLRSVIENSANKYVLIDFWASWCMPCMAEMPYLVEAYKSYHDKGFEIYGISFDTDSEKWMATIAAHELSWVHVSDLNRFDTQAGRDYGVNSIPANFLIDCATGKIIASNLRGAALDQKLAELLK